MAKGFVGDEILGLISLRKEGELKYEFVGLSEGEIFFR
jgi:hypothetical protein